MGKAPTAAMYRLNELHLINLLSLLLIVDILVSPESPFRIVLGVPLILFFPGYTLLATLYPRREDLDDAERVVLSFVFSLAIVPLIGLTLNLTVGIHLTPVLISGTGFIAICSALAARARRRLPTAQRFGIEVFPFLSVARSRRWWLKLCAVAMGTISIAFIGWHLQAHSLRIGEKSTEFYILGPSGKAEGYPDRIIAGGSVTVILGIINHELQTTTYAAIIRTNGQILETLGSVTLDAGQKWERSVQFRPLTAAAREKIEFLLFKNDDPAPYRRLHLWVSVLPP